MDFFSREGYEISLNATTDEFEAASWTHVNKGHMVIFWLFHKKMHFVKFYIEKYWSSALKRIQNRCMQM